MKIKKLIPVIMALGISAAAFGGCTENGNNENNTVNEYAELNAMLSRNYSQIVLTVTNTFGEETVLTDEYAMKFSDGSVNVKYSVERFTEISIDSAASEKTKIVGEAVVAGGEVTYVQGKEVNLDAVTAGAGLNFKEEYFENIDLTGNYLKADVRNPSGFMGSELSCTEMKVYATFFNIFYEIKITYKAQNGNSVEYLYDFSM